MKKRKKPLNRSLREQLKSADLEPAPPASEKKTFADVAKAMKVDPLVQNKAQRVPREEDNRNNLAMESTYVDCPSFAIEDEDRWLRGWRQDRPKPRWRSLQKSHLDASLDLHGMRRDEAKHDVEQFLKRAHLRRLQVVRIIVGKGHHSGGGRGVLREEIADWLSSHPCGLWVGAFCSALPPAGGDGAIVIALAMP